MFKNKRFFAITIGCIGLFLIIFIAPWTYIPIGKNSADEAFSITFLNVGQGDAILIQSDTDNTILIDGGPDKSVIGELKAMLPRHDKTIETIILTHPDSDHAAGIVHVLDYFDVKKIYTSGLKGSAGLSQALAQKIHSKKIPTFATSARDDFIFFSTQEKLFIDVLYPFAPIIFSHEKANNDSVITKIIFREHTFLLTGDIEAEVEEAVVKAYRKDELNVEILKLAHHGSKTSSIPTFIRATSPALAIASVGKNNRYNHPSPSVVSYLEALHIPLLRSDVHGRISFKLMNNGAMKLICSHSCEL